MPIEMLIAPLAVVALPWQIIHFPLSCLP